MTTESRRYALIFLISLFSFFRASSVFSATEAIVGGNLVNLDGEEALLDSVILLEGNRISAIGKRSELDVPDTADVINAQGKWLIPGLMNMHVHLGLVLPGKQAAELVNEQAGAAALGGFATGI